MLTESRNMGSNCLDLTFKAAEVNTDMPFAAEERITSTAGATPLIDAIYMPTQSHRPPPATDLNLLAHHSERVYLLFSDSEAKWSTDAIPKVVAKCDLATYFDLDSYLGHPVSANPSVEIAPQYDIPSKRTWALIHARSQGYAAIGMIDDDIQLSATDLIRVRQAIVAEADFISFHVLDYPDVSTIDLIERIVTRVPSRASIGGNCLFMVPQMCRTFFPFTYNDDWFFILLHLGHARIKSLGTATQRPYAPWESATRVRFEQFGDIIIEGMKRQVRRGEHPFRITLRDLQHVRADYLGRLQRLKMCTPNGTLKTRVAQAIESARAVAADEMQAFVSTFYKSRLCELMR